MGGCRSRVCAFSPARGAPGPAYALPGSSIDLLRGYVNLDGCHFRLLVAWMAAALRPVGPYPAQVRAGNERVVRPRLSDAAFFWQQHPKVSLEVHASHLSEVTFQAKLGSYAEKTQRLKRLALWIGERIAAGADVGRAAELCKADLMTAMVGEFPELQGIMGRYYEKPKAFPENWRCPSKSTTGRDMPATGCPRPGPGRRSPSPTRSTP